MASAAVLSRLSTLALLTALIVLLSLGVLVIREMDRLELAGYRVEHSRRTTRATIVALAVSAPLILMVAFLLNRRALLQLDQAQRRAKLGEARLRVTLQSCGDALIATDLAGNIVLLNPVAQALTGWREEQALGVPVDQVFRIVNEFTRATVENPVSRALREGKVVGLANSTVLIARDGRELPIDDSGAPIVDESGEPAGVILVFRDVTSRKLSEQARERMLRAEAERQAAVDANKAKDEFLALLSHELRSPLAAIRGWLDLIIGGFLSPDETPGALQRIYRNTRQQERLMGDLLDISRVVTGKLDVVRSPVYLEEVAATAVTECRPEADQKGVSLAFERPGERLLVMGDEQRLVQILNNIICNAIRFTHGGGSVNVALGKSGSRARIAVSDTGIGMSQETLSRLFERFWQAGGGRTRTQGGLGLGLHIAKYLVEEHGGTIQASSDGPDTGSTFTVEFPLLDTAATAEPRTAPVATRENDLAGLSILIVDDERDSRDAMHVFLQARGARVRSAASVREAILAYESDRPDLIVSDIGMPNEDGYALARQVREKESPGEARTSLVALTAYAAAPDRKVALEQGFDAFLAKPVELEELGRVILKLKDEKLDEAQ